MVIGGQLSSSSVKLGEFTSKFGTIISLRFLGRSMAGIE
jgi:hypothetical protein